MLVSYSLTQGTWLGQAFISRSPFSMHIRDNQYAGKCSYFFIGSVVKHLCTNGVVPRTHGNKGKLPKHAMKFDEITQVVDFIKRHADIHAVPSPGQLPKLHDYPVMKLPSDVSKATVYRDYVTASKALQDTGEEVRIISYRQFHRLWPELVPSVTTVKPSSDLCFICQENVVTIVIHKLTRR